MSYLRGWIPAFAGMTEKTKFCSFGVIIVFALFFAVQHANAAVNKTCPTANNFVTCTPDFVCGGNATQCSAALPADPDPLHADRYSLNCSATTCNVSAWECNTDAYPCGGAACTAPTSTVGGACSSPIGGTYSNQCGACSCPSGTQLCQSSNTCVAVIACAAGTTFDPCTNSCTTPYFLKNQATPQDGYLNITGDVKSSAGDLYLASGKAVRVDGAGLTRLNVGNFTGNLFDFWVDGTLNLGTYVNAQNQVAAPIQLGTNQNLLYGAVSGVAPGATNAYLMKLQNPINTNVFTIDPSGNINTAGGATFGGAVTFNSTVNISGTNSLGVNGDLLVGGGYSAGGITLVGTGADKGKLQVGNGIVLKGQVYQEDVQELRVQNNKIVLNANGAAQNATIQVNNSTGSIGWNEAGKKWTIGDSLGTPSLCLGAGAGVACKSSWDDLSTSFLPLTGGTLTGKLTINNIDGLDVKGKITASGCFGPVFVGITQALINGNQGGYFAADALCDAGYTGSHVCTTAEILNTKSCKAPAFLAQTSGNGWILNGVPGFTANANDCIGRTSASHGDYGAFWQFDSNGGQGWLSFCDDTHQIACCK